MTLSLGEKFEDAADFILYRYQTRSDIDLSTVEDVQQIRCVPYRVATSQFTVSR